MFFEPAGGLQQRTVVSAPLAALVYLGEAADHAGTASVFFTSEFLNICTSSKEAHCI